MPPAGPPCKFCAGSGEDPALCDKCLDKQGDCYFCLKDTTWDMKLDGKCKHCEGLGEEMYSFKLAHSIVDYTKATGVLWLKREAFSELLVRCGTVVRQQEMLAKHGDLLVTVAEELYTAGVNMVPVVISHLDSAKKRGSGGPAHHRDIAGAEQLGFNM